MGLVAWWPLDGNEKDYSGNKYDLSNNNVSFDNNGKIGKCALFSKNGTQRLFCKNFPRFYSNFSWTAWLYCNGPNDAYRMFAISQGRDVDELGINITVGTIESHGIGNIIIIVGSSTTPYYINTEISCLNCWRHVAIVCSDTQFKVYIDGQLLFTYPIPIIDFSMIQDYDNALVIGKMSYNYAHNVNYFPFNGKINDVRIYDHALSDKEVYEISRAKILHYTFDDFVEPTENLLVQNPNMITPSSNTVVSYDSVNEEWIAKKTGNTSTIQFLVNTNYHQKPGKAYALSFEMLVYGTGSIYYDTNDDIYLNGVRDNRINNNNTWRKTAASVVKNVIPNKWFKVTRIATTKNIGESIKANYDPEDNTTYIVEQGHTAICTDVLTITTESDFIKIRNIQFEEKDHATPYTNGKRDYKIIRDCSGFGNDGLLNLSGLSRWVEDDSKIGRGAYRLYDKSYILIPNPKCKITDQISVSVWAYRNNWQGANSERIISCTESGGWSIGFNDTQGQLTFSLYANNKYDAPGCPLTDLSPGWHYIVGTYDGRYVKLYVDGVLVNSRDKAALYPIKYNDTNSIFIGAEPSSSPTEPEWCYWDGMIDDVRIYAVALTPEDINCIYKNKASIDNKGNIYVTNLIEYNNWDDEIKANNLVLNGNCEFESNLNFPNLKYDSTRKCFYVDIYRYTGLSNDFIPVNNKDVYKLSGEFKDLAGSSSIYYFGVACFDSQKREIKHEHVCFKLNTKTTLAAALKPGDTTVTLTSSANWSQETPGQSHHTKIIGFWPAGSEYPTYTYTRMITGYLSISDNVLTLETPWNGPNIPAGTPVANMYSGNTYLYIAASSVNSTSEWVKREGSVSGWHCGDPETHKFRYGTKYIRIMIMPNYDKASVLGIRDIKFWNSTLDNDVPPSGLLYNPIFLNTKNQLKVAKISEVGITDGLVGWWPLIHDVEDISGVKKDVTYKYNSAELVKVNNKYGAAYKIGHNKYINMGINMYNFSHEHSGFTLSVYVYPYSTMYEDNQGVIFGGQGWNWGIIRYNNKRYAMLVWGIDSNGSKFSYNAHGPETVVEDEKWTHVVGVYDHINRAVKIYIDGVLKASAGVSLPLWFDSPLLKFGSAAGSWWIDALVCDGRLYNRVLTDEEVMILYNSLYSDKAYLNMTSDNRLYINNEINEIYL